MGLSVMVSIEDMERHIWILKYHLNTFLSKIFPKKTAFSFKAEKYKQRLKQTKSQLVKTRKDRLREVMHTGLRPGFFMKTAKEVDVIVPVYAGFKETRECIFSVISTLPSWARLVVINDASPDESLSAWLEEQAAVNGFTLIRHEENKGFVETVNHGMAMSPVKDVVLLNSDAEVANNWLERMRDAAYSMGKIASVTPFSNNATICSFPNFPNFHHGDDLPCGLSTRVVDEFFSRYGKSDELIEIPTGVGFCMYIRRDCLNEVGLFDAKTFGRGYGEETDWCQRAIKKGWVNVHQLNLFVYHKGSVSFGIEGDQCKNDNGMQLIQKHPGYPESVSQFCSIDPAKETRVTVLSNIINQLELPKILFISHYFGGGVEVHLKELSNFLSTKAHFSLLIPKDNVFVLYLSIKGNIYSGEILHDFNNFDQLYSTLNFIGISRVHYHHLLGFGNVIDRVLALADRLCCDYDITVHDYYLISGSTPKMTDQFGKFIGVDRMLSRYKSSEAYDVPFGLSGDDWRKFIRKWWKNANRIIYPSDYTFELFSKCVCVPEATTNSVIAWHLDYELNSPYPEPVWKRSNGDKLRILVLGALSLEKGADFLENVAKLLEKTNIEFHLLGISYRALHHAVNVHGLYNNNTVNDEIYKIKPAVAWFPARWPETYSYTLSIALENALPIIAPNFGSFPERLARRSLTFIVDWDIYDEDMKNIFMELEKKGQSFFDGNIAQLKNTPKREADFYKNFYIV
jgi:GT2 family glycosyltransferase